MRGSVTIAMREATILLIDGTITIVLCVTPARCRGLQHGIGEVGGGSHERPDVKRFVNAAATFLAGGL